MNKVMEIVFNNGVIQADYQTGMVSLNDVMAVGNMMRTRKGLPQRDIQDFYKNKDTKEFMEALYISENLNMGNSPHLKSTENQEVVDYKKLLTVTKRGRSNGGTYGHLLLAMKLATWLDKEFEVEVYKTFIEHKIMDTRKLGCDSFKELNSLIFRHIDCGSFSKKEVVIEVAKMVNAKVKGRFEKGWDEKAILEQQEERAETIKELTMLIKKGYVKTYNDLIRYFI